MSEHHFKCISYLNMHLEDASIMVDSSGKGAGTIRQSFDIRQVLRLQKRHDFSRVLSCENAGYSVYITWTRALFISFNQTHSSATLSYIQLGVSFRIIYIPE
jgi:hypothetical protein